MFSIAVTGGIASGKSLFGKMLAEQGADVMDADDIVRRLHRSGGRGASLVASAFGDTFLLPDGGTDRVRLAACVFEDAAARRHLETLLHPLVRDALLSWKQTSGTTPIKIAQIPLLFESGWEGDWDLTVTLEAPRDLRVARLLARGLSRAEAEQRISAQMTSAKRAERADVVITNGAGIAELEQAARRLMHHVENPKS